MPGSTVEGLQRRIATPKWLPAHDTDTKNNLSVVYWILEPRDENITDIVINFEMVVYCPLEECMELNVTNKVIFRSGGSETSPIVAEYCLNELPNVVELEGPIIRLEFLSFNINEFGFLGEYQAGELIFISNMKRVLVSFNRLSKKIQRISKIRAYRPFSHYGDLAG